MPITLTKQALTASVTHADLVSALTFVSRKLAPPRYGISAILSGVLLETTREGELVLSTFDYENCYRQSIQADVTTVGKALVPAKFVADMIRGLDKKSTISLHVRGNEAEITGDGTTYTVDTLPIDDYPALPDGLGESLTVLSTEQLIHAADVTLAAGRDDTLPVLTAVSFESIDGTLHLVATDRYRLSAYNTGAPHDGERVLIPAATIKLVASSFKSYALITKSTTGEFVTFTNGERAVSCRTIDGTFPDWQRLMPATASETFATVNGAVFTKAIEQVSKVAARTTPIQLSGSGVDLLLEAANNGGSGKSKARKTIAAEFTGHEVLIQFNPGYLADGIKSVGGGTVRVDFVNDPQELGRKPVVLTGDTPQFRYLLMPVRTNG